VVESRTINVTVQRYLPGRDTEPYEQTYQVELSEPNSVLNVLDLISQHKDPTLGYQASCRRGFCSICTVKVNGKAVKTCLEPASCDIHLEPAAKPGRIYKDLAIKW
jgi:succinate dehydrogenase/fumarate reductase-like Fe-S protein